MEVHAKSKFDYETIKELAHRSSYRLLSPKVYWIFMIICTFIVFGTSFLFGVDSDDIALMIVIVYIS